MSNSAMENYLRDECEALRDQLRDAQQEIKRLTDWLLKIDGGDAPCTDEGQMRQWAYEAVTLRRECP